jgi:trans-aconitate 2-methyltransferase
MTDPWNPSQYDRFKDERSRPFFDLLAMVEPRDGMRVVDLGCGTGALTRAMHDELRAAETLGVDSSPAMLEKARAHTTDGLRFELGDIATWRERGARDLVFSNAALHWLGDHPALLARISEALASGGQLAVQVPANFDHPSHTVASEVAREEPFRAALAGEAPGARGVLAPEAYAEILDGLGFGTQRVRLEVYAHHLPARDDVVEWVKGTLLTDYEKRLPSELWPRFLDRYRARLLPLLKDTKPYLFPFKRILFWGRR